MERRSKAEELKASLLVDVKSNIRPLNEPYRKPEEHLEEKADEIVGKLCAQIGQLERGLEELCLCSDRRKMINAINQLRFITESMACQMRDTVTWLGLATTKPYAENFKGKIVQDPEIKVMPTAYGYVIRCPFRLPSKNTYRVNEYWWGGIEAAIRVYCKGNPVKRIESAMIAYMDLYPFDCPLANFTDADNQDIKKVTDVIREHFLTGDDSVTLWILQLGKQAKVDKPYSEIHLVDRSKMTMWFARMGIYVWQ